MQKRSLFHWFIATALVAGTTWVQASETPNSLTGAKVVGAAEVKKMLDAGTPVIDTRVVAEYAEKAIKGAKSVPYKEKSAKEVGFDPSKDDFDMTKLPQDKAAPIIFYCNAGECWKSYKASTVAIKAGYTKVFWFRGGMPEWVAAGLPTQ